MNDVFVTVMFSFCFQFFSEFLKMFYEYTNEQLVRCVFDRINFSIYLDHNFFFWKIV